MTVEPERQAWLETTVEREAQDRRVLSASRELTVERVLLVWKAQEEERVPPVKSEPQV